MDFIICVVLLICVDLCAAFCCVFDTVDSGVSNPALNTSIPFEARSVAFAIVLARAFGILAEDNLGVDERGTVLGTATGRGARAPLDTTLVTAVDGARAPLATVLDALAPAFAAVWGSRPVIALPADLPADCAAVRAAPLASAADSGDVSVSSSIGDCCVEE